MPTRLHLRLVFALLVVCLVFGGWTAGDSALASEPDPAEKPRRGIDPLPEYRQVPQPEQNSLDNMTSESVKDWYHMVFQSFRDGNWEIYSATDYGKTQTRLTWDTESSQEPKLNPQATQVVYTALIRDVNIVYKINADGSGKARLTKSKGYEEVTPSWTPDGQHVVYSARLESGGTWDIYLTKADGTAQEQLILDSGENDLYPAWSPDGTRLAWVRYSASGLSTLWVMDLTNGEAHPLTDPVPFLQSPRWSPSGNLLAFDADLDWDGWNELGMIFADGTGLQTVYDPSSSYTDIWMGSWYRDQDALLFTRLDYTYYQGELYLQAAYVLAYYFWQYGSVNPLFSDGVSASPDYVSTDRTGPDLELRDLADFTRANELKLRWEVSDTGGSGLESVLIQMRDAASNTWTDIFNGSSGTGYSRDETPGQEVYFRARARDKAMNWGDWSSTTPHTKLYAWEVAGRVLDNRGYGLPAVDVAITPAAMNAEKTGADSRYLAYLSGSGNYQIQAVQPGFASLPAASINVSSDRVLNLGVSPADDVLENGSFEANQDALMGWTTSLTATLQSPHQHTGQYAARLGIECLIQPCLGNPQFIPVAGMKNFSLAADSQGRLHMINFSLEQNGIVYRMRSLDGSWSDPAIIPGSNANAYTYEVVELVADASNNLYAIWANPMAGPQYIYFSQRSASSGRWSVPLRLEEGLDPSIAVDNQGGVHIAYEGASANGAYYLERLPSGHWNPATLLEQVSVKEVRLAVGPDNALHFIWYLWADNWTSYLVRQANGRWSEQEMLFLNPEGVHDVRGLSILVDRNNHVHVIGSGQYMTRAPGGAWSEKEVFTSYSGYMQASMASDSQGNLYLLYVDQENQTLIYRARINGGWSQPWLISDDVYSYYDLALDGEGRVHVAEGWLTDEYSWGIQYYTNRTPAEKMDYWIQQQINVPETLHKPTLSFWYSLSYGMKGQESGLSVQVQGGDAPVEMFSTTTETDWKHAWVDMSLWVGQTVTVTLTLQQAEGEINRHVYLDDISLGSWLTPVVSAVSPNRFNWDWTSHEMTITGENLLPGAAVYIADLPVQDVEWIDESMLRIKLPAGLKTGRHDLWVTNPGGQVGALPDAVQLGSILYLPFAPD